MRPRFLRGLRAEGTALLLAFVVALEVVYAWAALSALRDSGARVAGERLEEARALAQRFDGLLALGRERLAAIAEQPGLSLWLASGAAAALPKGAAIPQRETLHYLFFRSEIFSGPVAVADRAGNLLWTEPYDAERVDARLKLEHPALKEALATRRGQVSRLPLAWRPGPSALLVEPILDLGGAAVGALLGEIALGASKLAGFLDDPRYGGGTVAVLLDEEGKLLLGGAHSESLWGPLSRGRLPEPGTSATVASSGLRLLAARAPLTQAPWSVLVAQDDAEAFASLRGLQLRLLLTGLLLGAAALAFSLAVTGRLVRPIEVLTEAAAAVPRGDLARPVPEGAPGELGDLSRAFDSMRRELRSTLTGLRDSEERWRRSIDSANDAIFSVDPVGLQVLQANRKACEVLGTPEAQLAGRPFPDALAAEQRHASRDQLVRACAAGSGTLPDVDLLGPAGTRVPVSVSASLIVHGSGRFLQLICRDLSERKKMERELVQAEKLSTVGVLAAGLLHELNTPLSYVHANLEEAQIAVTKLAPGPVADQLKAEVADAIDGARRANTIVRDLRIFARGTQGPSRSFDLNDALRVALRMAQHEVKYRAKVVSELGQLPPVVGHATELSQVFLNLIINAAHAIPPGQPERHRITLATRADGGRAVASVRDTGSGIPPEVLPRIFEPFFTTKPEGVGTGLGLAICRDIVTRVGGTIRVESKVGEGTEFTVELPLEPAE